MTDHYITGRNDGIHRNVESVPPLPDDHFTRGYQPVLLEIAPGKWVRQIVANDRIEKRRQS